MTNAVKIFTFRVDGTVTIRAVSETVARCVAALQCPANATLELSGVVDAPASNRPRPEDVLRALDDRGQDCPGAIKGQAEEVKPKQWGDGGREAPE